jgi:hypothetical protein
MRVACNRLRRPLTRWQLARRFGAYEDDKTNAWRRRAGKGQAIAAPSVFAAELDRGLSASASTRASTAVRGTTGE